MQRLYIFLFLLFISLSNFSQSIEATKIELNFLEGSNPQDLVKTQSGFFFTATDGTHSNFGRELWYSNGTTDGTYRVKDINSGKNSSNPSSLIVLNNTLFFTANDGIHGTELWKSDGTEAGTILVKDIKENNTDTYNAPGNLVKFNGKVYFTATDDVNGFEFWVSDGTEVGTYMLKDINPNDLNSFPSNFIVFNNTLYFIANDGINGRELWKSDGSETGTVLVKNINNISSNSINGKLIISGNQFFFYAKSYDYTSSSSNNIGNELWKSDGTASGTVLVKDIRNGNASSSSELIGIDFNGELIFQADDGVHGIELWKSDGTEIGTKLIKDINNSSQYSLEYNNIFTKLNNEIYFIADDNIHGFEIWKTDGTTSGTKLVKDINQGSTSVSIKKFHVNESNNKLLFFNENPNSSKRNLWVTDGTENGTKQIPLIESQNSSATDQSFCNFNNLIYFSGSNEMNGNELFVTNGTEQNTLLFKDLNYLQGSSPAKLTDVNDKLFFRASIGYSSPGSTLFSSDGTKISTKRVKTTGESSGIDDLSETVIINNKLFFSSATSSSGYEPWISDGTDQGTFMVKDINPNGNSLWSNSNKQRFFVIDNIVYFSANNGVNGYELWRSDGTEVGTFMIKDIFESGNGYPRQFVAFNSEIYFLANDSEYAGLWKTDGTESGTKKIINLNDIRILRTINNKLVMVAETSGTTYGAHDIWVSDGTETGTNHLMSFGDGINSSIDYMVTLNNELFFVANNPTISKKSIYKTNGISVNIILDGNNHPEHYIDIDDIYTCGSYVYFGIKYDPNSNKELWRTNGTTTEKIDENNSFLFNNFECHKNELFYTYNPSSSDNIPLIKHISDNLATPNSIDINISGGENFSSSFISNLTSSGNNIYFSGRTDLSGEELFVITPDLSALNIDNFQSDNESKLLKIYPNPSNNIITIKNQLPFNQITIYNLKGRLISRKQIASTIKTNLKVNNLSKGIYLIEIISGQKKQFQKLIIE